MSKISTLFEYMRQCPQLNNLWSIFGEIEKGSQIIFPRGSSPIYAAENEGWDVTGEYVGTLAPYPSIFEDFQIDMIQRVDPNDDRNTADNINIVSYDEVERVCNWLLEQNAKRNLPKIEGLKVLSIEPTGTAPIVWSVDDGQQLIIYAITVRLRYVNPNPRIDMRYEAED